MAKNSYRSLTTPLESASKRHKLVWSLIQENFSQHKIYQEYPVIKINTDYYSAREHYDIVILDLKIVIEVHGEQHSRPVRFGGISEDEALLAFNTQKLIDIRKKTAAQEAGFTFIEVWHDEEISYERLFQKIQKHFVWTEPEEHREPKEDSEFTRGQRKRAKEYRREHYLRRKAKQKQQQDREKLLDGKG